MPSFYTFKWLSFSSQGQGQGQGQGQEKYLLFNEKVLC